MLAEVAALIGDPRCATWARSAAALAHADPAADYAGRDDRARRRDRVRGRQGRADREGRRLLQGPDDDRARRPTRSWSRSACPRGAAEQRRRVHEVPAPGLALRGGRRGGGGHASTERQAARRPASASPAPAPRPCAPRASRRADRQGAGRRGDRGGRRRRRPRVSTSRPTCRARSSTRRTSAACSRGGRSRPRSSGPRARRVESTAPAAGRALRSMKHSLWGPSRTTGAFALRRMPGPARSRA